MQLTEVFKWKRAYWWEKTKNKKTFSEKQNLSEQKQKKKKKKKKRLVSFSLGINFNLIVSHLFQLW